MAGLLVDGQSLLMQIFAAMFVQLLVEPLPGDSQQVCGLELVAGT